MKMYWAFGLMLLLVTSAAQADVVRVCKPNPIYTERTDLITLTLPPLVRSGDVVTLTASNYPNDIYRFDVTVKADRTTLVLEPHASGSNGRATYSLNLTNGELGRSVFIPSYSRTGIMYEQWNCTIKK
ncbi:MAG: hypothetical protein V4760_10270 [Bdellovibrionota bacterium]